MGEFLREQYIRRHVYPEGVERDLYIFRRVEIHFLKSECEMGIFACGRLQNQTARTTMTSNPAR
jgi:hypothetical protein